MSQPLNQASRWHDLAAVCLGGLAAVVLISAPWQVDTSGPDPFYKGPLIFPLLALALMILASLPAAWRLITPQEGASWQLDDAGMPLKTIVVLGFLILFPVGLVLIGLEATSWGFLFSLLYYLGYRGSRTLILVPLIVTGVLVLIFKYVLDVFFPTPLLMEFWQ
ncbi:MAG: tripartite tricarboxylate transporter TctB family protein [Candidatus Vecturithrix sp.]|jgi:hypothetical protein|nr:tripartite tricarboxylate transporter TctB family protein [Candidatus Vecturithrix sp.]